MQSIRRSLVVTLLLMASLFITSGCDSDPTSSEPGPPTCSIIAPSDSQSVADMVMVSIRATDEIGIKDVLLYIDGVLIHTFDTEPYNYEWDTRVYQDSSWHTIYAVAWNQNDLSASSDTIDIMVDYSGGSGQNVLIVANQFSSTLTLIDLYAGGIIERDVIGVGNVPNDILRWGNMLFVINSLSNDMNVINLSYSNELIPAMDPIDLGVGIGRNPQYGAVSGGFLYISNALPNNVTVINLASMTPAVDIHVGKAPAEVRVVGNNIYVCNSGYSFDDGTYGMGSVSVIENNMVVNTIEIGAGKNPQFMDVDRSGRLHVVCTGNYDDVQGEINIIDPVTDLIVNYIYIGGQPGDIAINSLDIAYVAAGGWLDDPGKVFRYNALTGQIMNGVATPIEVGTGAMRIVAAADNSIYVSCMIENTVDKIVDGVLVDSYIVGDGPVPLVIVDR